MKEAYKNEIDRFKKEFCYNEKRRIEMSNYFSIEMDSFEELLPGKEIHSYAYGNRRITTSFIIFKVTDEINNIVYNPVFSESVGRKLAKVWDIPVKSKMNLFADENRHDNAADFSNSAGVNKKGNEDNRNLRRLIILSRSMILLHIIEPRPMDKVFKEIYNKLESNKGWGVYASEIKSINTAISSYINSKRNKENENFSNINDYITYIESNFNKRLIHFDFSNLRRIFRNNYPDADLFF